MTWQERYTIRGGLAFDAGWHDTRPDVNYNGYVCPECLTVFTFEDEHGNHKQGCSIGDFVDVFNNSHTKNLAKIFGMSHIESELRLIYHRTERMPELTDSFSYPLLSKVAELFPELLKSALENVRKDPNPKREINFWG